MIKGSILLSSATGALLVLLLAGRVARAESAQAAPAGPVATSATPDASGDSDGLSPTAEAIDGEVAVDLSADLSDSEVADLERRYGLRPNNPHGSPRDRLEVVDVSVDREDALIDALSHEHGVDAAEPMEVFRASFVPDDPLFQEQWHLQRVGAEAAWEYGCGRGVTVAVIDTGVACFDKGPFSRGSDLSGTRCEGGYNFVTDSDDAYDDQGHGTHVAGTVAQTTNNGKGTAGLAFCARLMPIKVLNRFGWGTLGNVAEGVRYAADHGAQVINLSLGGPGKSRILEASVKYAQQKGVLVVAAAGNTGKAVGYPAAYDGVVAVSATDSNDTIAWFSSRGPQVSIAAPGVGVTQQTICQAGRNKCELFGTFSGTSMASPHVAGSAALLMGLGLTDASSVRAALLSSARSPNADAVASPELYGAGILDVAAAMKRVSLQRVGLRLGGFFAILWWIWQRIRRRRGKVAWTGGTVFGALVGGVGLVPFLPVFHALPRFGAYRWLAEVLGRPFGEWDVGWSAGFHRWLPLANALPVLLGMALFFGVKRLRPTLGGFAAGSVALLLQLAVSLDVVMPIGALPTRLWLAGNAAVCLWLARIALERDRKPS